MTKQRKKEKSEKEGAVKLVLNEISPITETQEKVWHFWQKNYNLVLDGAAGSGKSFIALYLCLEKIVNQGERKQIVIIRSPQATSQVGFLPGTLQEKESAYMLPYVSIVNELFKDSTAFKTLEQAGIIKFMTTAFIRGISLHDCYVIVDEMQNCTEHELDSVITRAGRNTRYIFTGDYRQSDLERDRDRCGILEFLKIVDHLKYFKKLTFTWEDVVRSGIVRDYLMVKEMFYQAKLNGQPEPKPELTDVNNELSQSKEENVSGESEIIYDDDNLK